MKALVADGHVTVVATGVDLAPLPGVGPTPITRGAPVVTVKPTEVVVQGTLVADPRTTKADDLAKQVTGLLAARPGPDIVLVIDGKVAWSTVAPLLRAVAAAKHSRVTLVFAAGQSGAASRPPPSSIDAEASTRWPTPNPAKPAPDLAATAPDGNIASKVFADCAAVPQKLFPELGKLDPGEFDVAVVTGMPAEIEACGCRVEMAAVQRLMWAWWGRDSGPALAAVKIEIAADAKAGTAITAKPDAPWSEASQLLVAAAEQGKPISLK